MKICALNLVLVLLTDADSLSIISDTDFLAALFIHLDGGFLFNFILFY